MKHYQSSWGIILRARPGHKSIIVLDQKRGKITGMVYRSIVHNLLNASMIEYTIDEYYGRLNVTVLEQHAQPAPWAAQDIFFMHHILELCTHYLPEFHEQPEVFCLLGSLYHHTTQQSDRTLSGIKLALLCKLYMLMGIYPAEGSSIRLPISLISRDSDSMLNFQYEYDQQTEKTMICWLREAFSALDTRESLKTSSFLKRLGVLP